ncbi:l-type lectin-domain containing receptor kinase ix.1 [Quercus suber]|uniref:L-type lectin-domain containing receptor kinase ix.1 n=1 Tax=Quercus suber TaxID=58331 RepID=A0AAW0IW43_QUESU
MKIFNQLRHQNLVQVIRWCHDRGEFLLVYEFMPNGSLDTHLFGKRTPLTWEVRYKIFLGLASAVFYLHEESEQCVVHHDIKASNVMLDYSFNAKLGDFGYIDPEYLRTGKASKESDMYSFGVIALEIVTRRKSIDPIRKDSETGLLEPIWNLYGKGDLLLACPHPDRNLRPFIRQAIQVLKFEATMPTLPIDKPFRMYRVPPPAVESGGVVFTSTNLQQGR